MMTQCAHGVLSNGIDIFLEGVDKGPSKMNDRRETLKISAALITKPSSANLLFLVNQR